MSNNKDASNASKEEPPKKRRGRPPKSAVAAKTAGKRNAVGRPKGDAAIINEYKARMLASPKSVKVLESIFDAALDPEHKNQASAWKLLMDRMLPVSAFEKEVQGSNNKNAIQINISGVGGDVSIGDTQEPQQQQEKPIEAQFEEVVINEPKL
jgi:hypothetical protein